MCIICNTTDPHSAVDFLTTFSQASGCMKKATAAMLETARSAPNPEHRRAYDRAHKRMVRLMREWNQIEHERELIGAKD